MGEEGLDSGHQEDGKVLPGGFAILQGNAKYFSRMHCIPGGYTVIMDDGKCPVQCTVVQKMHSSPEGTVLMNYKLYRKINSTYSEDVLNIVEYYQMWYSSPAQSVLLSKIMYSTCIFANVQDMYICLSEIERFAERCIQHIRKMYSIREGCVVLQEEFY